MRILRNYVLIEILSVFLSTLAILTLLLVCGNVLTKMADLVINMGIDPRLLLQLFVYSTPFLFGFTVPTSVLVSVLLVFGKLSQDQEINAMKASGINLWRLVAPILVASLILSLCCLYLNDRVASQSHFKVRKITAEIGLKQPASILEEGVFIKQFKDIVLFIHRIDKNQLRGIRIYQPQSDGPTRTIVAESGELVTIPEQQVIKLKLYKGTTDKPDPNHPEKLYKLRFDTYMLPLNLTEYRFGQTLEKKHKEMSIHELLKEDRRLKKEHNFNAPELLAEVHRKIAMSFASLIFALIGIPLAIRTRRGEKSVGFGIALVLTMLYWTLLMGGTALANTGTVPAWIAMHLPNLICFVTGTALMKRLLRH